MGHFEIEMLSSMLIWPLAGRCRVSRDAAHALRGVASERRVLAPQPVDARGRDVTRPELRAPDRERTGDVQRVPELELMPLAERQRMEHMIPRRWHDHEVCCASCGSGDGDPRLASRRPRRARWCRRTSRRSLIVLVELFL